MDVKINVKKNYVVNGKEYHSLEEMPANIRQIYETAFASKGVTGPLSAEGGVSRKINFNGRVYSTPDEMPADARKLYEKALSMARRGGSEVVTSQQYVSASITPGEPAKPTRGVSEMRIPIWAVFLLGALASRHFFGLEGRLVYFVVVLVGIALFRRPLVIGLTHVASKLGLIKGTIDRMPMSIKLVKAAVIDEAAKPVAAELSASGFVDAGAWDIFEMPQIRLALMVHPAENFLAAIETASAIGAQLNVHTLYANGNVATFTNSRLPAPKAQRPGLSSVRMPGASTRALLLKARAGRPGDGISAVTVEEAPRIYERLYTESISYRKAHGA